MGEEEDRRELSEGLRDGLLLSPCSTERELGRSSRDWERERTYCIFIVNMQWVNWASPYNHCDSRESSGVAAMRVWQSMAALKCCARSYEEKESVGVVTQMVHRWLVGHGTVTRHIHPGTRLAWAELAVCVCVCVCSWQQCGRLMDGCILPSYSWPAPRWHWPAQPHWVSLNYWVGPIDERPPGREGERQSQTDTETETEKGERVWERECERKSERCVV